MKSPATRWAILLLFFLLAGWYVAQAMLTFAHGWMHPWTIGFVEPQTVYGASRVTRGMSLYRDYRASLPIAPLTYGPLEYWIPGKFAAWRSLASSQAVLQAGRLWTAFGFLASLAMMIVLAWQRGARWASFLAPLPLLLLPEMWNGFFKFVPDFPCLAFSLAGWAIQGAVSPLSGSNRREASLRFGFLVLVRAGVVLCWLMAFFLKPTIAVTGPAAAFLEALFGRRNSLRGISRFSGFAGICVTVACWAALSIIGLLAWNHFSSGLLWLNLVHSGMGCRFSPLVLLQILLFHRWVTWLPYLVLMIGACLYWNRMKMFRVWLCLLLVELLLMMKQGSDINYTIGSLSVGGIGFALAVRSVVSVEEEERPWYRESGRLFCLALLCWAAGLAVDLPNSLSRYYDGRFVTARDVAELDSFADGQSADRVLVLAPFYAMSRHWPLVYCDGYHADILEKASDVSFSAVAGDLKNRKYPVVISGPDVVSPPDKYGFRMAPDSICRALEQNYVVRRRVGKWFTIWQSRT